MTSSLTSPTVQVLATVDWLIHHQRMHDAGLVTFDFLAAQSLADGSVRVTTHVMNIDVSQRFLSSVQLGAGATLTSLVSVYPASRWHEREALELVGVKFDMIATRFPLLVTDAASLPLRLDTALGRRLTDPWPGIYEPGPPKRRQKATPGVRASWSAAAVSPSLAEASGAQPAGNSAARSNDAGSDQCAEPT